MHPPLESVPYPYSAVIFGSTGMIGRALVKELAISDQCHSVLAIVRCNISKVELLGEVSRGGEKVIVKRVNFDNLPETLPVSSLRGRQVIFYCLGTTIKIAGSVKVFQKVNLGYLEDVTRLTRVSGADHFCLVSTQWASPSSRLLSLRTKGLGEKAVISAGYPHVTIWRLGHLGWPGKGKLTEKVTRMFVPEMSASKVATAMRLDAEGKVETDAEEDAHILTNRDVWTLTAKLP